VILKIVSTTLHSDKQSKPLWLHVHSLSVYRRLFIICRSIRLHVFLKPSLHWLNKSLRSSECRLDHLEDKLTSGNGDDRNMHVYKQLKQGERGQCSLQENPDFQVPQSESAYCTIIDSSQLTVGTATGWTARVRFPEVQDFSLPRENNPRYPLHRRLGGPQSRIGRYAPAENRTPVVQSIARRYTD
jgi:hypothetical protein